MTLPELLTASVDSILEERLKKPEQRAFIVRSVMAAFSVVPKKQVSDLPKRMLDLEKRLRQMTENICLSFVNGRLVVKVVGSSDLLMKELRRGTNWYEPWEKVDEIILAAALVDPSK